MSKEMPSLVLNVVEQKVNKKETWKKIKTNQRIE